MSDAPVYFVLGATGGIGRDLCDRLSQSGARLALCGRDQSTLDAMKTELGGTPPATHSTHAFDATEPGAVETAVASAAEHHGRLDGIVNLVGSILLKPAHLTSDDEFEKTLRLNLWTAFATVRAAGKTLRKSGGSVVLMATAAARQGIANHEAIAAAKGGVIGLAQSAAATYAPNGIRFNVVAPGLVDTGMAQAITANEMALKASTAMHALGRIGQPSDVAPMIQFLLSPQSSWISAQVLGVDGGLSRIMPRVKV
jgi:NAD(P)-dependent dehydrogenase (short-subunit alcohol dehydrogenase family)